jgi:hypothetical protein
MMQRLRWPKGCKQWLLCVANAHLRGGYAYSVAFQVAWTLQGCRLHSLVQRSHCMSGADPLHASLHRTNWLQREAAAPCQAASLAVIVTTAASRTHMSRPHVLVFVLGHARHSSSHCLGCIMPVQCLCACLFVIVCEHWLKLQVRCLQSYTRSVHMCGTCMVGLFSILPDMP